MPIKWFTGSPASNKPPKPEPTPDQKKFPTLLNVAGRHVWVSHPIPDRLAVIGDLLPSQFPAGFGSKAIGEFASLVMMKLASGSLWPITQTKFSGSVYTTVVLRHPETGSAINFKTAKSKSSDAVHSLRIEFNPTRLGYSATLDLLDGLNHVTNGFKVGAFLSTAKVTRLDIAVDFLGVAVPELILSAKTQGKRAHYYGADGLLESVYVHKAKPKIHPGAPPKTTLRAPLGSLIIKMYDKARERQAFGLPRPFGAAPMTRVEIERRRFGNKPFKVSDLPTLSNPFAVAKLAHWSAANPGVSPWEWLQYLECRKAGGPNWSAELLGLNAAEQSVFETALAKHPNTLLNPGVIWGSWPEGLEQSGLGLLVEAADHFSSASHITDLIGK